MTIVVNGSPREARPGLTGGELLAELGIPASTTVAEVNRRIIPREQFATLELRDGDELELVSIVGGG